MDSDPWTLRDYHQSCWLKAQKVWTFYCESLKGNNVATKLMLHGSECNVSRHVKQMEINSSVGQGLTLLLRQIKYCLTSERPPDLRLPVNDQGWVSTLHICGVSAPEKEAEELQPSTKTCWMFRAKGAE